MWTVPTFEQNEPKKVPSRSAKKLEQTIANLGKTLQHVHLPQEKEGLRSRLLVRKLEPKWKPKEVVVDMNTVGSIRHTAYREPEEIPRFFLQKK